MGDGTWTLNGPGSGTINSTQQERLDAFGKEDGNGWNLFRTGPREPIKIPPLPKLRTLADAIYEQIEDGTVERHVQEFLDAASIDIRSPADMVLSLQDYSYAGGEIPESILNYDPSESPSAVGQASGSQPSNATEMSMTGPRTLQDMTEYERRSLGNILDMRFEGLLDTRPNRMSPEQLNQLATQGSRIIDMLPRQDATALRPHIEALSNPDIESNRDSKNSAKELVAIIKKYIELK